MVAVLPAGYEVVPILKETTVIVSAKFTSVSLVKTLPEVGVSSFRVTGSSPATGSALPGSTVMRNWPISVKDPSLTV